MNEELPLEKPAAPPVKPLTDEDWIPLGKYAPGRGDQRKLKDVPASYLLWLWDERLWNEKTPLAIYVYEAYNALKADSDYEPKRRRDGTKGR